MSGEDFKKIIDEVSFFLREIMHADSVHITLFDGKPNISVTFSDNKTNINYGK